MAKGHVKWFSNPKGYGFILMEDGAEVFVHHSLIEGSGYKSLKEGELVEFELVESDKGKQAHKVMRLEAENAGQIQNQPSSRSAEQDQAEQPAEFGQEQF